MKPTLIMVSVIVGLGIVLATGAAAPGFAAREGDAASDLTKLKGTWIRELGGRTYILKFNEERFATMFEFDEGT